MKNNSLSVKYLSLLFISLVSVVLLSSFKNLKNISADANAEIPYVQIISSDTYYLPAEGGEIEIVGTATQSAATINSYLMSKGIDYISISGISENIITIEVLPNNFGYEIVIAVSGRNGGSIRIVQEG